MNFDDVRKRASLPTRVVPLCLAGELVEQADALERKLAEAKPPTSLGEKSERRVIAEQIEALRDEMVESTVDFRLRALPTRKWMPLSLGQPVRGKDDSDEAWGERQFAWQLQLIAQTCVEPEMTPDQVGELVDLLHARAWATLVNAAMMLNIGEVDLPNSAAASDLTENSEQT